MSDLASHIENAFDLSYLQSPEFPQTKIKSIGILGGGTAGYLTALALNKSHPSIKATVIESSKIPVIGVGESTTTEIVSFLHNFLEIDPLKFFAEVQPTLKLGIRFDWGCPGDYKFNFNFFAGHQLESFFYEGHIENANWPSVLMNQNKVPVVRDEEGSLISFLNNISFSYHLDNKRLVKFLNREIKDRGVEILDREIVDVKRDENGHVASLNTQSGEAFSFDLYIDCSGFRSKLLGEALQTEFIPFKETLITNKALTFDLPDDGVVDCYTSVITMKNGWCWKIPVRNDNHFGYVFSTQFATDEEALSEVRERFGNIQNHKYIDFRSGRHEKAWNKNVLAFGNAYGFIEPLESTALQILIHSVMAACRIMPNSHEDTSSIAGLNQEIASTWDTFRWFVGTHYKFNKKLDTPFWKWCRENVDIGDAKPIIALFNERPPLSAGKFGTATGFTSFEPLVFNSYSYDTLLFGQKEVHSPIDPPQMTKDDYLGRCESYRVLAEKALSQQELLKDEVLFEGGLLQDLFEDPSSWIRETYV